MSTARVDPVARIVGELIPPGDKSISHRALLLGVLGRGRSYVGNLSPAADVASTAECLRACGSWIRSFGDGRTSLDGDGRGGDLRSPDAALDCGNSGTTMRLLTGLLAGRDLEAVLDGDASLRRRPMERVAAPLRRLGAEVTTTDGRAPLRVIGRPQPPGLTHTLEVASAQLKSAILLACIDAEGPTTIVEPAPSRDHTERMLRMCGATVESDGGTVTLAPGPLEGFGLRVPGDLSAAAFAIALAAATMGSSLRCRGVTLNPGRTGVLDALRLMGADVEVEEGALAGGVEPCGDVVVRGGELRAITIEGALVPRCIDELPVLAVLATRARGVTEIRDAAELRVKESDRIAELASGLRALGAEVEEREDGLAVVGPRRLRAARLDAAGDHRLAMAWAVAGMLADGPTLIDGAEAVAVSNPRFFEDMAAICVLG